MWVDIFQFIVGMSVFFIALHLAHLLNDDLDPVLDGVWWGLAFAGLAVIWVGFGLAVAAAL